MCNGDRLKGFMPVSWKSTLYADDEHGYDTEESTFNAMKTVEWIQQVERAFEVQSVRFSNNYHMDLTKKSTEDKITQTDNCLTDKPSTLTEGSIEKTITFLCAIHTKLLEDLNLPSELDRTQNESARQVLAEHTDKLAKETINGNFVYAICRDYDRISSWVTSRNDQLKESADKVDYLSSQIRERDEELSKEKYCRLFHSNDFIHPSKLLATLNRLLYEPLEELNKEFEPLLQPDSCILDLRKQAEEMQKKLIDLDHTCQAKEMANENLRSRIEQWQEKHEHLVQRMQQIMEQKQSQDQALTNEQNVTKEIQLKLTESKRNAEECQTRCQKFQNMIQQLQEQLEQAKLGLEQVTKLKDELLQKMEEYKHQNQLLAQYPDLNGPLRNTMEYAKPKSIEDELSGQIQANQLRIALLTEQTNRLVNAYTRIRKQADRGEIQLSTNADDPVNDQINTVAVHTPSSAESDRSMSSITQEYIRDKQRNMKVNKIQSITPLAFNRSGSHSTNRSDVSRPELWSGPRKSRHSKCRICLWS
ncbi:hypothetical protein FBUS_06524 [Fasciolopsis buskii]|uniref:Uncharacterized protein n=1 Tax=Fasciolopsis buskii TaxID=27845 RepID=A0A8E0RKP7_9TREM|nr:hypothetical protein FBUS_06524 [Fasciolopsis buski]